MSQVWQTDETIAALASPPGGAARGTIRLSGGNCRQVLETCFAPDDATGWQHVRRATRFTGSISLSGSRRRFAASVCLWPSGRSYTGEPAAELQLPGAPPLLEAVLLQLHGGGARPARPGEFTLRAFLAGRIDLVQAEAVLGVIDAGSQDELQQALRQLSGGLSIPVGRLRSSLLDLLADLEAGLDFVDEDIEFVSRQQCLDRLADGISRIDGMLAQDSSRSRAGSRWKVVLAGLPNAGKSTLFNALGGDEAALVSPIAGTTRDWLAAAVTWHGLPIELIDTAGREQATGGLSSQMQQQGRGQLEQADLILWCTALPEFAAASSTGRAGHVAATGQLTETARVPVLSVITMIDRTADDRGATPAGGNWQAAEATGAIGVCALNGQGLDRLVEAVCSRLGGINTGEAPALRYMLGSTQSRCRARLSEALVSLRAARDAALASAGDELVAAELRAALEALGEIAGTVCTNDLLDRIFSRFCIGK